MKMVKSNPIMITAVVLGLFFGSLEMTAAQIGACFGSVGDNFPANQVVALYNQYNVQRMRIYGPDNYLSDALRGSNIELMIGVANQDLPNIASSQSAANTWVQNNILNYHPGVKFRYIAVGNEIRPDNNDNGAAKYAPYVGPAMWNIQIAINGAGLGGQIKVSTALEMGMLSTSYPPSAGEFKSSLQSFYGPILDFIKQNGSPFFMNVYPYFTWMYSSDTDVNYYLFTSPGVVVSDGQYGYQNMFDAQVDAVYSALEKAGAGSVGIVVSETGWPTAGGKQTDVNTATTYINKLIQHVKNGTPKRPGALETYIFEMIDEDGKSPELEKHWGLFGSGGQPKYNVNFS